MAKPKKLTHSFNLMLGSDDDWRLQCLQERNGFAASVILRSALQYMHAMECLDTPTCASGNRCMVPHLFAKPAAPPSTDVPLQNQTVPSEAQRIAAAAQGREA